MATLGTLTWAQKSGGRITFRDRLTLTLLATGSLFRNLPDLMTYRLGWKRRFPSTFDLENLKVPDTAAARTAENLLTNLTPPYMVNHSLRTYWFSRLIGLARGISFDDELLYVASLTHDLGFYGRYAAASPDAECFSIRSAKSAVEIAEQHEWSQGRRDCVAETVILNVNGDVPLKHGAEAHLMMLGVLVDATGTHAWRIHPSNITDVFQRLPLLDQKEKLWTTFSEEADRHPQCRGYFAKTYLQFGLLMKLSPWK